MLRDFDVSTVVPTVALAKRKIFETIWRLVDDRYPLFDERGVDWDHVRREFEGALGRIDDYAALYSLINEMLLRLHDPHTTVLYTPWETRRPYPFGVWSADGQLYVTGTLEPTELRPLMRLTMVDGQSVQEGLEETANRTCYRSRVAVMQAFIASISMGGIGEQRELSAVDEHGEVSVGFLPMTDKDCQSGPLPSTQEVQSALCQAKVISDGVGYIRLLSFRPPGVSETVSRALQGLDGCRSLILDVRGNAGGLLSEAISTTSLLLEEDRPLGFRQARGGDPQPLVIPARTHPLVRDLARMIVLCDESTMSTAEFILVQGLKGSAERVSVVGSETAGLVHDATVYPLFDGSRVQVTTYRHMGPDGATVPEVGIVPDIEVQNGVEALLGGDDLQLNTCLSLCG